MQPINILGKRYRVTEKAAGYGGGHGFGHVNHHSLTIELQSDQAEAQKRDTLLHEVIHAIDFAVHLELKERHVHALAAGLLCVLRDNPELVERLTAPDAGAQEE